MKIQNVIKMTGVALCLIGAILMFDGNILGERTTGIATLTGIVGISVISTSVRKLRGR
jgi:hypothetical protein